MSIASDMVKFYLEAERAVLQGQEVAFGDRKLRMTDLQEIRNGRIEWEARLQAETSGSRRPTFRTARLDQ